MSKTAVRSKIQLSTLLPESNQSFIWKGLSRIADKVMGLDKLQSLYDNSPLPGLGKQAFGEELLRYLNVDVEGYEQLKQKVPENGPVILVSNHPFGCIEGVALATLLNKVRPDVKVLANKALSMFAELKGNFIFINPLNHRDPKNLAALKQCRRHLANGGLLLIFPAGKVSYYLNEKQRVCDDTWNRLPAQLAKSLDCPVLPLFVEGQNSRFFINMGRLYYRFKLLLLFREMLKQRGSTLKIKTGNLIRPKLLSRFKSETAMTEYMRALSYSQEQKFNTDWPEDQVNQLKPMMAPVDKAKLSSEIQALPKEQHLADYKTFSVFYGYQSQMPNVVKEICRLRELVFRQHNEGSGEPIDTDHFDATYTHLFIYNSKDGDVIGAYRMGQTDKLLQQSGIKGLYLSRMFNFGSDFINQTEPCLEMGRSFIVPEHQRSFYGLFLLWRGIGEFVVRHPQYRTLYGTVSISKLYDTKSVKCIEQLALNPSEAVNAKQPFSAPIHPELAEFVENNKDNTNLLSSLVQGIEPDNKDVPILMKQYEKMNARFYCIGIDVNFNHTPGLLLSVNLPSAPEKALNQYLADGKESYLKFQKSN